MFNPLGPPFDALTKPKSQSRSSRPTKSATTSSQFPDSVKPESRAAISLEYASLRNRSHCPLGLYVVPSVETLMIWDAVLFVHQGYYADAILKFRLAFPPDYPERPPVVQFITDVFHPLIATDGTFSLAPQIRTWRPNQHHVFDVLHFIKASFKRDVLDKIEEADCLNKEAYRYHDSTTSFAALATQTSSLSQSSTALFDNDHASMTAKPTHGMHFSKMKSKALREERVKHGLTEWESNNKGKDEISEQ